MSFSEKFLILVSSINQLFLSFIVLLVLYIKAHHQIQSRLDFLLSYLLQVLKVRILHLSVWYVLKFCEKCKVCI